MKPRKARVQQAKTHYASTSSSSSSSVLQLCNLVDCVFFTTISIIRRLLHDSGQNRSFGEYRRAMRSAADAETPVDEMAGEFGLGVLIRVLAVEVGCPDESAFLQFKK